MVESPFDLLRVLCCVGAIFGPGGGGVLQMQLGRFDEAEKYLLKALNKSSNDATTLQVQPTRTHTHGGRPVTSP